MIPFILNWLKLKAIMGARKIFKIPEETRIIRIPFKIFFAPDKSSISSFLSLINLILGTIFKSTKTAVNDNCNPTENSWLGWMNVIVIRLIAKILFGAGFLWIIFATR